MSFCPNHHQPAWRQQAVKIDRAESISVADTADYCFLQNYSKAKKGEPSRFPLSHFDKIQVIARNHGFLFDFDKNLNLFRNFLSPSMFLPQSSSPTQSARIFLPKKTFPLFFFLVPLAWLASARNNLILEIPTH